MHTIYIYTRYKYVVMIMFAKNALSAYLLCETSIHISVVHCTVYSVHYTLYTVHCTLYSV